jgi:hypothetical protein
MGRFLFRLVALAAVVLLPGWTQAEACSCIPSGPPCQAYWDTPIVLDATVTSIRVVTNEERFAGQLAVRRERVVTVDVQRVWKGLAGQERIELVTSGDDASCGYEFKEGARYLVFAHRQRPDGRIEVSLCSATQPYSGVGEDAAFLAALSSPPSGGRIFGNVDLADLRFDRPTERLDGVTVVIDGPAGIERTTTKAGRYELRNLPSGLYRVTVDAPPGMRMFNTDQPWHDATLPNAHACFQQNMTLRFAGAITGQVTDAAGQPAARVRVEALAQQASGSANATTDAQGRYAIEFLPPGRYILGVNLVWGADPYPQTIYRAPGQNTPAIVTIAAGERVSLPPLILPPAPRLLTLGGRIAGAAELVGLEGDVFARNIANDAFADRAPVVDGRFSITLREGITYVIEARLYDANRQLVAGGFSSPLRWTEDANVSIVVLPILTPR